MKRKQYLAKYIFNVANYEIIFVLKYQNKKIPGNPEMGPLLLNFELPHSYPGMDLPTKPNQTKHGSSQGMHKSQESAKV